MVSWKWVLSTYSCFFAYTRFFTILIFVAGMTNVDGLAQGAEPRPNIVMIISDDQAWTDYGFTGHPQIKTPNLDQLARESAVFTRGYVPTALCRPSLATLMTGLYAHQHKISGNDPAWLPGMDSQRAEPPAYQELREKMISHADRAPLLSRQLTAAGYRTFQSGKWWEGSYRRAGFTHGMTRGFPEPGGRHGDDGLSIGRQGIQPLVDFIDESLKAEKPFFVWFAPMMPHSPHNPPEQLFAKYQQLGLKSDHLARYYAMVEWFDEVVGQVLEQIAEPEVRQNTLVVYVGDNGWIQATDEAGFAPRSKQSPYEGGTRQPIMFSWPGTIKPGARETQLCSSVDIVPTLLSAVQLEPTVPLPGIDLLSCLKEGNPSPREDVFGETFAHDVADIDNPQASLLYRWVIEGKWKLLLTYDGQIGRYARHHPRTDKRPQLYDLVADPHEMQNLADQHPQVIQRLAAKLNAWWQVDANLGPTLSYNTPADNHAPSLKSPNVIFIAIDDQNDWVGHLGGHPLSQTPNLDGLAKRGTTFVNAHCQAPLCNPSRTSVMLGLRPSTTGIHGLTPWFRAVDTLKDRITLPQHFHANGYKTLTTGKIYHGSAGDEAARKLEFDIWGNAGGVGAQPAAKLIPPTPMGNHPLMDWGAFPHRDEDKGDYQVAEWTIQQLRNREPGKPFFLAAGFFLPHVPCYVTQRWIDLFPADDSVLPAILESDRGDTPHFSWYLHWSLPEPRLNWVRDNNQWQNLARSYLASTTFVDAQIGRILEELREQNLQDETIVVVWGDHGWHLGEKGITGKNSLWDESTHVPLVFAGPNITPNQRCEQPAELLDIYPTLVELCGLPERTDLEGTSLVPQLRDANTVRTRPAITTHNQGNHSVRSQHWRYIRYADDSEELYDLEHDPNEWENLSKSQAHRGVMAEHRRWLPTVDKPAVLGSAHRVLTYDSARDIATWEGSTIRRTDPIPE